MFGINAKQKELIDREISIYKQERIHLANVEIEAHIARRKKEVVALEIECHKQIAEYEHNFHSEKETKGIEIAQLQAEKESLTEWIKVKKEAHNADLLIIRAKDEEINRLNNIVQLMIKTPNSTTINTAK